MPDGIGTSQPPPLADSVIALAGQLERLQSKVDGYDIDGLRADVRGITTTVAGIADELARLAASSDDSDPAPSWLWPAEPMSPDDAASVLTQLVRWARRVYVRYSDGALPECWLWHPDVIEELTWLRAAWQAAYLGPMASAQRAGDWHDRQRPGVVRRVGTAAGACSLQEHFDPPAPAVVPVADAATAIAAWWADPATPMPAPTGEQIRAADAAHRAPAGRR